ncbi:MAG: fumarate hydratase [bacterium]
MREINAKQITEAVSDLCMKANFDIPDDVMSALKKAYQEEVSPQGKDVLKQIIDNDEIAHNEQVPMCQDTGLAVFFVELGQDVHITGGLLNDAINEGVRKGYKEGYLRKSTCHPFTRKNVGDNTPAIIHVELVAGDKMKITMAAKGGGSENMSRVMMMKPSDGLEGIKKYIIERVRESGSNPCPPIIVGVGIGGTFERSALIAKKALLRPLGTPNPDPELDKLEKELLTSINKLGIGPMGLGGRTTALAVHMIVEPCHIASLPLAVNIQCHSARHKEIVL